MATTRDAEEVVMRDRSYLEAQIEQLRTANQLQTELLGMIAHELRGPLAVIVGFCEVLNRDDSISKEQRSTGLDAVRRQADRMTQLVGDLLDTSRLLYPEALAVGKIADAVQHARLHVLDVFGPGRANIEVSVDGEIPAIDQQSLKLILTNLLANAVKFSPARSTVAISSSTQGRFVSIKVANEGAPIPDSESDRIFEPFKRGFEESSDGVGLGLHIVKRYVEAYGGRVDVSNFEGLVIFEVLLPLADLN